MSDATSAAAPTPLPGIARLVLRIGCLLIEAGTSARRAQEAMQRAATGLGCDKIEIMCISDMIVVEARHGEERSTELRHIGHQGANLQLASAALEVVESIARGMLSPVEAHAEFDRLRAAPPEHPHWLICLAAGLGCAAFGRLLGADTAAFLPTMAGAAIGQWLRLRLLRAHVNLFLTTGMVSFFAALLAGTLASWAGSQRVDLAGLAAVLLLVPGMAALNAQKDIVDGHAGMGASRAVRVLMVVLFTSVGLLLAQYLLGLT